MTPQQFIAKWRDAELNERAASQSHFNDLCALLGVDDPISADPKGEWYAFEKGATKTSGGEGWADVWRKGCFAWEYKGKKKDLDKAFAQLQQYAIALENPPLLIVSDMDRFRIHTNWTNTVQVVHEFALDDLNDGATRDLLRSAFEEPERLRPSKTRQMLTEEAAEEFSQLAQRLRDRGHDGPAVAHFVNRLVFCMFAEDVGLLPGHMFSEMLKASRSQPETFADHAATLFAAMKSGGLVGFTKVEWFNGGLFDDDTALPLDRDDIALLIAAAKLDWSEVDPSILGTLFERGLDPDKRSQLGAHYTDRDKIMQIVEPVIIRPLSDEWAAIRSEIEELVSSAPQQTADKLLRGSELGKRTKALDKAQELLRGFVERLRTFRVLDPACGSGNFLYLSLLALKDLEHRANLEAEALGCTREFPAVGPECVLGIELNPYAAELARVSVWIGEIQWMRRNGFEAARNPILRSLGNIECRDAVLDEETGERARWPEANVVVGNPPFLGDRKIVPELGIEYATRLRAAYMGCVPGGADLVCYWFARAWKMISDRSLERAGLVATNSIRGGANREVLKPIAASGRIFEALSDEDWTVEGAAVRVSLICFEASGGSGAVLNGRNVPEIYSDLTGGLDSVDLTSAARLPKNSGVAYQGVISYGPFQIEASEARELLQLPRNPDGSSNHEVVKPWVNGQDITRRPSNRWIIAFSDEAAASDASLYEGPWSIVEQRVRPYRAQRDNEVLNRYWWRLWRSRPEMSEAVVNLHRQIITPRVSKHRLFVWREATVIADSATVAIARDDDTTFGILHSYFHELWALRMGTFMGAGNDPRYTPSSTFETFPFPQGLTPDIPAADYADDPRAVAIATAAARLDELRENWLNPPDLIERVPEVVPGYPDRIIPKDETAAKELKKRTLTNLYNKRPAWLDHAHRALDEAVADAYGWGDDWRAGTLTDDEILARLFQLNQERAAR
ncbi:class I SAM-dependent DNA methyltransferase [Aurantiacibacter hainanensis]|uniref:class I SAM-dependent DNA methyltransferase n=1 Tax=Aurantiacibacter hainanensis TaxID=3076114 RepID=UPI0030C6ACEF